MTTELRELDSLASVAASVAAGTTCCNTLTSCNKLTEFLPAVTAVTAATLAATLSCCNKLASCNKLTAAIELVD